MITGVYIFAKPPRPGEVKTRLARTLGQHAASALAEAFLLDTVATVRRAGFQPVLATTEPEHDFGIAIDRVGQGTGDLGSRLEHVLSAGLCEHEVVVAIGADSPGLPEDRLREVVATARAGRVGVIPARDGGFVALATTVLPAGIFAGVPWSSHDTLARVLDAFGEHGLPVKCREAWFDIDDEDDLTWFRGRVPRASAPRTWERLDRLATG